jgi:hypothetical protein
MFFVLAWRWVRADIGLGVSVGVGYVDDEIGWMSGLLVWWDG